MPEDLEAAIKTGALTSTTQLLPEFKQLQIAIFVVHRSKTEGLPPAELLIELQNQFMSTANNDEMTAEQLSLTLQRVQGLWDQIEEQTKPPRHLLLPDEDLISAIARKPHQLVPISPGTRAGPMTRNVPYK